MGTRRHEDDGSVRVSFTGYPLSILALISGKSIQVTGLCIITGASCRRTFTSKLKGKT